MQITVTKRSQVWCDCAAHDDSQLINPLYNVIAATPRAHLKSKLLFSRAIRFTCVSSHKWPISPPPLNPPPPSQPRTVISQVCIISRRLVHCFCLIVRRGTLCLSLTVDQFHSPHQLSIVRSLTQSCATPKTRCVFSCFWLIRVCLTVVSVLRLWWTLARDLVFTVGCGLNYWWSLGRVKLFNDLV